jgi:UPF0755 protein
MHIHPTTIFFRIIVVFAIISGIMLSLFSIPSILAVQIRNEQTVPTAPSQFPITVNPQNKTIVENAQIDAFFASPQSPFQAAALNSGDTLWHVFEWVATSIADAPWYQGIAAANAPRFVTIKPGMRKEQVASIFAKELSWNAKQQKEFMTASASSTLPLIEGSFSPGVYTVTVGMTPKETQALVNERFTTDILSHYGPEIAKQVPLNQALIIASLIQRETIGTNDMRLVSGVIWNRLFINMNLQIDATLQYAKANMKATTSWWPKVVPADAYLRSAHNTYLNPGLPPSPIANPSVAAVIAALNPIKTSCLFYFNDQNGNILCTNTYAQHVALLKKYYGQGK